MRALAGEPGLERLFIFHDQWDLTSINRSGRPASCWKIKGDCSQLGDITDIRSIALADSSGCSLCRVSPCFQDPDNFHANFPFPDTREPGEPCFYTIEDRDDNTYITFDKPINRPHVMSLVYTAYPPHVTKDDDILMLTSIGYNSMLYITRIGYFQEASDDNRARVTYEDYDKGIYEIKQRLAKRKTGTGQRSFEGGL